MHPLLKDATEEQRAAIQHNTGAGFVSSVPGSGKTRVITYRCAYLLDRGVDPKNIVGITFTNKAANEMKERVKRLVGASFAKHVWLSTFHSFCVRLLRANPAVYRVHPNFGISDENDTLLLVTLAMAHVLGKSEKEVKQRDGAGDVKHVRKWISNKKNRLLTPQDVEDNKQSEPFSEFNPFYVEYQRLLHKNNVLDFDDLIMQTVLRLKANEDQQQFYAEHLHHLMVDEWQDTNFTQFELVRLLSRYRGNVFAVGDDSQSIYKFRGADPTNTDRFYATYDDVKTYLLQTNFRSVPSIAAVANTVINNNVRQHKKQIITHKQGGEPARCVETENPEREAVFIINELRGLVKQGRAQWKDFAIIYRMRSQSRPLEDCAVLRTVPYRVIGALSFYNRAAIKDVLAYARLLVNPSDDASFVRCYNKPPRGIGPANFARFSAAAEEHNCSLLTAVRKGLYKDTVTQLALTGFRRFKQINKDWRKQGTKLAGASIRQIIHDSGSRYYAEQIKDADRREAILGDLEELIAAATTYDEQTRKSKLEGLAGFLEHAALMQQDDKSDNDNVVLMMTAHASKGLEFPNVFVCGGVEGVLPMYPRQDDGSSENDPDEVKAHYEEERRVFYVAITRAEARLCITWPAVRRFGSEIVRCTPSRFVKEAGAALQHTSVRIDKKTEPRYYSSRRPNSSHRSSRIPDGGADAVMQARQATHDSATAQAERDRRVILRKKRN